MTADAPELALAWLRDRGVGAGHEIGVAMADGVGVGLAHGDDRCAVETDSPTGVVAAVEAHVGPRWVWWDRAAAADLIARKQVPVQRCWDVVTVQRLLRGRWRTSVPVVWAELGGLDPAGIPSMGQLDLLAAPADGGDDPDRPVQPDGYLRPDWASGGWATTPERLARWAAVALEAAAAQRSLIERRDSAARITSTARAESAAELLCAELSVDGLPIDMDEAVRLIADAVGPRPADDTAADAQRAARDTAVLSHLTSAAGLDLRNPADVRALLRRVGVDVPDTRAWRLEQHRDAHPVVEALLQWRKAERISTTYGYRWLDEHVRDGRLRGDWSASDGAAGRMTASAGLHNMPAELRPAVAAEPGHVFVRADLGQVEPRVLAAVSGDPALIAATESDDLYQPVATRLGVTRDIAKVAVLGAMYGATTGTSAQALHGLQREYPVAMALLEAAAASGRAGDDVVTVGGRRVRMWVDERVDASGMGDIDRARSVAAARGRYARNAVIQGAAAELFKVWAVTVRTRGAGLGARIVLCLHDELLVHTPEEHADATVDVVLAALAETAYRWSPHRDVRFVADVSIVRRWSEAK